MRNSKCKIQNAKLRGACCFSIRHHPPPRARRAHPAHDQRLGREARHDHPRRPGHRQDDAGAQHPRSGRRNPRRHRPARQAISDREVRHRGRHRRRRRNSPRTPNSQPTAAPAPQSAAVRPTRRRSSSAARPPRRRVPAGDRGWLYFRGRVRRRPSQSGEP
jgi:hypothetical protein